MLLLYLAKRNALLAVPQQHQTGTKFHPAKKQKAAIVHNAELSTPVVEVAIKVINAILLKINVFYV